MVESTSLSPRGMCAVCIHPGRKAIEAAILGATQQEAAEANGVSLHIVRKHEQRCMRRIVAHVDYAPRERVDTLGAAVHVMSEAGRLGRRAERDKDIRAALLALREYARGAELVHRMQDATLQTANVERDARWIALRDAIASALRPYPEAAEAVNAAILAILTP